MLPFRKARAFEVHVSGGEYNVAANLADCFGLRTGIATAMVRYGIGELVQTRIRETGVVPFYKWFDHYGVRGPNIATVYSDRGHGVRPPEVFYNRANEAGALLKPGEGEIPIQLFPDRELTTVGRKAQRRVRSKPYPAFGCVSNLRKRVNRSIRGVTRARG